MIMKIKYAAQPAFYNNFHCIGNECLVNCCYGWGTIGWTKEEYEKLKNSQMSDELRKKFENSFKPVEDERYKELFDYQIEYKTGKKCPMLTEDNLCLVQKELGEKYLSNVCRVYPRQGAIYNDIVIRTCQCSCNYVLKMICNNEDSMKLENVSLKHPDYFSLTRHTQKEYITCPALIHSRELFSFFYELLSDKTHSIETSIVLCAMAAQKIDEFIKKGQADKIPEIIRALKPQLNNPVQIEKLENVKPNLSLKANISAALLALLKGATIYQNIFENGVPSEEKWQAGMEKFNETFKDKPFAMRNIALNLFISQHMPYKNVKLTLFENFCYFAAEISVIKFLAAAVSVQTNNIETMFEIAVANVDREFSHSKGNIDIINRILNAAGINSPAYLMGILK